MWMVKEPAHQLHFYGILFYKTHVFPVSVDSLPQKLRNTAKSAPPVMLEALEEV